MCIPTRYAILIHFCVLCAAHSQHRVSFRLEHRMHNEYIHTHIHNRTLAFPALTYTLIVCFIVVGGDAVIVVVLLRLLLLLPLMLSLVCRHRPLYPSKQQWVHFWVRSFFKSFNITPTIAVLCLLITSIVFCFALDIYHHYSFSRNKIFRAIPQIFHFFYFCFFFLIWWAVTVRLSPTPFPCLPRSTSSVLIWWLNSLTNKNMYS